MKMTDQSSNSDTPLVVGIGASAGGLDALKSFFNSFSQKPGMAFIVIIHLSPDHDSSMAELLQAKTSLKVTQVNETTDIEEDHVYVIPPNKILTVGDNHLELSDPDNGRAQVVDQFYRSLGRAKGSKAVSITLSGSGSDGATGMKTIKEYGGFTIVQDPTEAEYTGMPQSAIDTGLTDKILSVKQMPKTLMDYKRSLSSVRVADTPEDLKESEKKSSHKYLRRFSQKPTTILVNISVPLCCDA